MIKPKLYRHFDADDNLLYVGATVRLLSRHMGHKSASHWYDRIAKITIENFNTMAELWAAEKSAIETEKPLFNIQYARATNNE